MESDDGEPGRRGSGILSDSSTVFVYKELA